MILIISSCVKSLKYFGFDLDFGFGFALVFGLEGTMQEPFNIVLKNG